MSVKFYFVRHGNSTANNGKVFFNGEDAELTELGEEQAEDVGRFLRNSKVKFDLIFCSPYQRAIETCHIALAIAEMRRTAVIEDDRISERKFDGLVGRVGTREHNRLIYDYNSDQSVKDGIETLEALEARARDFIDDMVKNHPDSNILMFSHGAFGLAFRAVIEGRPKSGNLLDYKLLKHGEVAIYEV